MISHYLTITLRNVSKNKTFVLINVLTLTVALTCCILSYLNYQFRMDFDKIHRNTGNIYRINALQKTESSTTPWSQVPIALANAFEEDIEDAGIVATLAKSNAIAKSQADAFYESVHFTDTTFFSMFDLPMNAGNTRNLQQGKILISQAMSVKYFGSDDPLGRELSLILNNIESVYEVVGVFSRMPTNSSFQFDFVCDINDYGASSNIDSWKSNEQMTVFIRTVQATVPPVIHEKLRTYTDHFNKAQDNIEIQAFYLQPFREVAFSSDIDMPGFVHGSILNSNPRGVIVIGPMVLSLLILLIAGFNFLNTTIAMAGNRLKEIGVRKVLGGVRMQLIIQFIIENMFLCGIALIASLIGVEFLLPMVNEALQTELVVHYVNDVKLLGFLLALLLGTAIVSGIYPAYFISSFKPVAILKGRTTFSIGTASKVLLVLQFAFATFGLVVGIVMAENSVYQQSSDMGYDMNKIHVTMIEDEKEFNSLRNVVSGHPDVEGIAGAEHQLGSGNAYKTTLVFGNVELQSQTLNVGSDYLSVMGVTLMDGRYFNQESELDYANAVIINKTLAHQLGFKGVDDQALVVDGKRCHLIGIVNDHREYGNHGRIPPIIFKLAWPPAFRYVSIRTTEKTLPALSAFVKAAWKKIFPDKPHNGFYQQEMMEKEIRLSEGFKAVSISLALVTILLSAGGLYSMMSLNILKRLKEIAIRKVIGSSTLHILGILCKQLSIVLMISFVAGGAFAYLVIDKLIFKVIYAYHSGLSVIPFVLSAFLVTSAAMLITGTKIYKAVRMNPADVLKND